MYHLFMSYKQYIKPETILVYLVALQGLDFLLTYTGVSVYGTQVEGNFLIRKSMENIGVFWGLFLPKALAVSLCWYLYKNKEVWTQNYLLYMMYFVVVFYLVVIVDGILALHTHGYTRITSIIL